jgi:hypothetical protein
MAAGALSDFQSDGIIRRLGNRSGRKAGASGPNDRPGKSLTDKALDTSTDFCSRSRARRFLLREYFAKLRPGRHAPESASAFPA